ncbi:MAG: hypothetical protein BWY70_00158 [Bacteroidetes bacterium ADurb.Bin408]|nr:MAG: hypothetical protein BWY70_00158 [Bacteroidetes bacterium ADurb.Bin408]
MICACFNSALKNGCNGITKHGPVCSDFIKIQNGRQRVRKPVIVVIRKTVTASVGIKAFIVQPFTGYGANYANFNIKA